MKLGGRGMTPSLLRLWLVFYTYSRLSYERRAEQAGTDTSCQLKMRELELWLGWCGVWAGLQTVLLQPSRLR